MAAGPFEPPGPRACVSTGQAGWLTTSTLGQAVQPRQQAASAAQFGSSTVLAGFSSVSALLCLQRTEVELTLHGSMWHASSLLRSHF